MDCLPGELRNCGSSGRTCLKIGGFVRHGRSNAAQISIVPAPLEGFSWE
jgi:hypothetical protein